ncbi:hypothetical protein K6V98_07955 [Collinsella sp. AGMB00827]|uniref:Uncharacterized protein n=1 Tax=Collinsella ureilytica TaxID=2869515 RepID=A0ABS7MLX2_9ACTN|nr:hypothetical protein [Collinsella urealyticum]MBY4798277.1 hypothetical protein [Collinsella urealyticum]
MLTLNCNEDGSGGVELGKREETFYFNPAPYNRYGWLAINKTSSVNCVHGKDTCNSSSIYSYQDGHYYNLTEDLTDPGMGARIRIGNQNNGSSPTNKYQGGDAGEIFEIHSELKSDLITYTTFRIDDEIDNVYTDKLSKEELARKTAAVKRVINEGNTRLFGVRADKSEKLIKEHVQMGETIPIV